MKVKEYAIEMENISMSFDGVEALQKADLNLEAGKIMGLVGKNGAGKSTLLNIIHGIYRQKTGNIKFFGKKIDESTSIEEREKTISMIYQDFSLIPGMSVTENIFLNVEPKKNLLINDNKMISEVNQFFNKLEINIDPREKVKNLDVSDMQFVEIAKAILRNKKILLMDEPTSALEIEQTQKLFDLVKQLRKQGISIIFITHHLQHIMEICDNITVLRDGQVVLSEEIKNVELHDIIESMLGGINYSQQKRKYKSISKKDHPLLKVENISSKNNPRGISFELYSGEVLGLAGLKGSGRTELLNNLFGIEPVETGRIILGGKVVNVSSPSRAVNHGIFLIPENRQVQGLSLDHSLYANMIMPLLDRIKRFSFVDDREGASIVNKYIKKLEIQAKDIFDRVSNLSGGNQQKVVISKALATKPKILLMDDPTYGVDIQAKVEIMKIVKDFTREGTGVIFVSSELEELLLNCDRILAIKNNEIINEINDVLQGNYSINKLVLAIQ